MIPPHDADDDGERDEKIDAGRDDRRRRDNHARKVNLGDQIGISHQTLTRTGKRGGKKLPRQHPRKNHQAIWRCARVTQFRNFAKYQRKNYGREYRPYNAPQSPDHCLFIPYLDISPA